MVSDGDDLAMFDPAGGGACPVQYAAEHGGVRYHVHYRHGWLTIEDETHGRELLCQRLSSDGDDGTWSDAETNAYLRLISEAIRAGTLPSLVLPDKRAITASPQYQPGPLPRYHVRLCDGGHGHTSACYSAWTLSAREMAAWVAEHGDDFRAHPLNTG